VIWKDWPSISKLNLPISPWNKSLKSTLALEIAPTRSYCNFGILILLSTLPTSFHAFDPETSMKQTMIELPKAVRNMKIKQGPPPKGKTGLLPKGKTSKAPAPPKSSQPPKSVKGGPGPSGPGKSVPSGPKQRTRTLRNLKSKQGQITESIQL